MSTPAADASASTAAATTTTYTLDDAMKQANAARTDAATLATNAQTALSARAKVVSVNASGTSTAVTNPLIAFGPDPSLAPSGCTVYIQVPAT